MELSKFDLRDQIAFYVHRYSRSFQPTQAGSAVGGEYEDYLRASLGSSLALDFISSKRDMGMGQGLASRSGLRHELDLIARKHSYYFIFELKHYAHSQLTKDMLLVFNQKVLDFYVENYRLLKTLKLYRVFVTRSSNIDESLRQFCALWGILLLDQEWYSPPICQIILSSLAEGVGSEDGLRVGWSTYQLEQLRLLQKNSSYLTDKMWRELGTIWNPQSRLPGRGFGGGEQQLPPAYVTRRWITQHQDLALQTLTLKNQYEKWRNRTAQEMANG